MGATVSQCAHACCSCCLSSSSTRGKADDPKGGKQGGSSASTTQENDEEADSWLQKGKVPLLSARHDREIVEEGVVVRKVMAARQATPTHRASSEASSPRPTAASLSPPSPKRGLRAVAAENRETSSPVRSPRPGTHPDNSPNSSNDDDSWELASPGRSSPNAPLDASGVSVSDDEDEETKAEPRRTTRSQRSESAASHGSPRGDEEAEFDEETKAGSPRSPHSPSRQSSGSGSPKRKGRYGRKNYRADSSRKKTL